MVTKDCGRDGEEEMKNRKQEIRRLLAEYVQELAGEDNLFLFVDIHQFIKRANLTDEDDEDLQYAAAIFMKDLAIMTVMDDTDVNEYMLVFTLTESIMLQDDMISITFNPISRDVRKGNKNWLVEYMEEASKK